MGDSAKKDILGHYIPGYIKNSRFDIPGRTTFYEMDKERKCCHREIFDLCVLVFASGRLEFGFQTAFAQFTVNLQIKFK